MRCEMESQGLEGFGKMLGPRWYVPVLCPGCGEESCKYGWHVDRKGVVTCLHCRNRYVPGEEPEYYDY